MDKHVGPYPYPSLTVMDPPLHALRSGMMEYPTFITCGSFYRMPKGIRTMESLVAHEFAHQYFMAIVASNEKEEPWLDEGLVTYFEDRIMEEYYGEKTSLLELGGYRVGNIENSRIEYTSLPNPSVGIIARPGWEIKEDFKGLVYSKMATILETVNRLLGEETKDSIFHNYYRKWKFKHPKGKDFLSTVHEVVKEEKGDSTAQVIRSFMHQALFTTATCDFRATILNSEKQYSGQGLFGASDEMKYKNSDFTGNYNSQIRIENLGSLKIPVEIIYTFEDGTEKNEIWLADNPGITKTIVSETPLISVQIDPENKIFIDLDHNNNSYTRKPAKAPLRKYAMKAIYWVQNSLQGLSFLM